MLAGDALDLSPTRELALALGRELREGSLDDIDPARANAVLIELAHMLIPVNYTRSGPFEHDLALGLQALPGLADAATLGKLDRQSNDFRFLRARLLRERNRIEHGLRAALRVVRMAQVPAM